MQGASYMFESNQIKRLNSLPKATQLIGDR